MTVRPPSAEYRLPTLIAKCPLALEQEGKALVGAPEKYANDTPVAGCQWEAGVAAAGRAGDDVRSARFDSRLAQSIIAKCTDESDEIHDLIRAAGRASG